MLEARLLAMEEMMQREVKMFRGEGGVGVHGLEPVQTGCIQAGVGCRPSADNLLMKLLLKASDIKSLRDPRSDIAGENSLNRFEHRLALGKLYCRSQRWDAHGNRPCYLQMSQKNLLQRRCTKSARTV